MVKNRYEKVVKKRSEKGGFFFTLLALKSVTSSRKERRWEEFWGPRGGLPLTCGVDPFPFPTAPRPDESYALDFQDLGDPFADSGDPSPWIFKTFKTGLLD